MCSQIDEMMDWYDCDEDTDDAWESERIAYIADAEYLEE